MDTGNKHQIVDRLLRFRGLALLCVALSLLAIVWLIAACAPTTSPAAPLPTEGETALPETATLAPTATAGEPPAAAVEPSVPLTTELKATIVAGLPPTPTPDAQGESAWGEVDVGVLPLDAVDDGPPLWAAFSVGMGFYDPEQGHFVAIYTHDDEGWRELDRQVLTWCVEFVGDHSLAQVQLEPSRTWLEMQSGTGAHSGCYELLSFDGEVLRSEAANFNSSPGAGYLEDLDGDGFQEVVLDQSENYVFCYACGLRLIRFQLLRWDGEWLVPVELATLPETAPANLWAANNRAVELAQAGLWKGAKSAIDEALALDAGDPADAETVAWNGVLIDLHAGAEAEQVRQSPYPLLDNAFYGDYDAAVDVMRPYSAEEIWGPETPLVDGTIAEGWEFELTNWISYTTNMALQVQPDLAPAVFLRGWGAHLRSPGDPQAVADVERAAALAPDDPLFSTSAIYLQVPISLGPPAEAGNLQPLNPGACYELGQALMQTLKMTVTLTTAPFEDYVQGGSGDGCQSTVTGTGAEFGSGDAVAADVQAMLEERGWQADMMYAADGPTATVRGFRQEGGLCLLSAGWSPAEGAECPPDRPISECDLAPEQQLYTVTLNCVQEGAPVALPSPTPVAPPSPTPVPLPSPTPVPPPSSTPVAPPTPTPRPRATTTPVAEERWEVRTLLAGPGEPGRLYALLTDQSPVAWPASRVRFLISDDYGQTWTPFPGGLPAPECVRNVNLDYATPDALYASTCQGLFRWTGSSWSLVSPQETGMVAVVYGNPQVIWATEAFESGAGVIRSQDGGASWVPASSGLVSFNGVANLGIDPRDANTLYAVIWPKYAGSYLRRGTAGGQWQTMPTPKGNLTIGTGMTIDGASGDLYVIVNAERVQLWRTGNPSTPNLNDVRWEMVHDFGRDYQVELLASGWGPEGLAIYANVWPLDWKDEEYAEVGAAVLHRSVDGGQTWEPLPLP